MFIGNVFLLIVLIECIIYIVTPPAIPYVDTGEACKHHKIAKRVPNAHNLHLTRN